MDALWYIESPGVLERWGESFREHGRVRRWGHRAVIDFPGADPVHLVLSGSIDVHDASQRHRLRRGELYGFLADGPQLRAYDDTVVLELFPEALERLGDKLVHVGLIKPREVRVPLTKLLRTREDTRVLATLAHLAGDSGRVELELKARELARATGMDVVRTRAVLNQLQRANLVEVHRRGLVIPDTAAILTVLKGEA